LDRNLSTGAGAGIGINPGFGTLNFGTVELPKLHLNRTTRLNLWGSDDGREAETRNPVTMLSIHK
jgi:hypothetical protein